MEKEYNLVPTLEDNDEYKQKEAEYLKELLNDDKIVERIQDFAERNAYKDTDRRTYQAMEALIHNLNTMHSRAGAQIPPLVLLITVQILLLKEGWL